MLKLKRHHGIVLVLIAVFLIAWAAWTFVALPRAESPNLPAPAEAAPGAHP